MNAKNFFDQFLQYMLVSGQILGPIFIHSQHGVAILNSSEETTAAILQMHQQAVVATTQPPVPAASEAPTAEIAQ